MSEPSKTQGYINSTLGAAKENLGNFLGDESMKADGNAKKIQGDGEIEEVKAKNYAEGTADRISGAAKDAFGYITGDQQKQTEGKLQNAQGQIKQSNNE